MKNYNSIFGMGILMIALFLSSCSNAPKQTENTTSSVELTGDDLIKRGEYLVETMGCHDCHSPKKMGPNGPEIIPELMLSGYPAERPIMKFDTAWTNKGFSIFYPDLTAGAGPWGVSFAGNLTPDVTGIGTWTEEQFKKAITEGKFKGLDGGRMLLPPMPWTNLTELKDEDVKAMFAYLKSIPAVRNVVPAPIPPENM